MFARDGFPFNFLISVLVSMTTLYMFSDFYARQPKTVVLRNNVFSIVFLSAEMRFHYCIIYFSYSASSVWGNQHGDTSIYLDNITRILDRLLDGYDNRLRPGFGGMLMTVSHCILNDVAP